MLTKKQIAVIHTAKAKTKLSDDQYRDLLSGFNVTSSKELNYPQFLDLMKTFETLGFKPILKTRRTISREEARDTGTVKLATGKQQRYIIALWNDSPFVREKTAEALNHFIKRIAKVDRLEWLPGKKVNGVVLAIKNLDPEFQKDRIDVSNH